MAVTKEIALKEMGERVQAALDVPQQREIEPGLKFDGDKLPLDLLSPTLMTGIAKVLAFGANKYGARNWEKGMSWSRPYAALLRHMLAFWQGEELDPETGLSHLWHAGCCLMFLIHYEAYHTGTDDRPK